MTGDNLPALLRPLDGELPPEARNLAASLRVLFDGLEISVRRYAARRSRDAGAVSRYLNGTRLPPWQFILELTRDLAIHRGESIKGETLELLRTQHRAAAKAQGTPSSLLQITQHALAEADRKAQQSVIQMRILNDALHDKEALLGDVELQLRQVQEQDAIREIKLINITEERDALLEEKAKLQGDISSLRSELSKAAGRARDLEEECSSLENKLATLEGPQDHELPSGSMAFGMMQISNFTRLTSRLNDEALRGLVDELGTICQRVSLRTGVRFIFARSSDVVFTGASATVTLDAALVVRDEIKKESGRHLEEFNSALNIGLCYGQVFTTNGALYGLTVSRAESLCKISNKGQVLASEEFMNQFDTERATKRAGHSGAEISIQPMWQRPVIGLGVLTPWIITRADVH
ncbi:hypothetical protein ACIRD6_09655 [Streptomyces sp. NPDC102473]|uniref:hypothetical protein n=1 Tax=Streptomyces sp. NPDC102473 TaxID=3366180 RepID=UPI0038271259